MKPQSKVRGILIDPFQCELYPVAVSSFSELTRLLDCQILDAIKVHGTGHCVWIDDEGLLRQPFVYPHFMMPAANNAQPMAGYGLLTGMDDTGEITDCQIPLQALAHTISFEPWRARIPIDSVIPQMLRLYNLGQH